VLQFRLRPPRHARQVPGARYNRPVPTGRVKRRLLNLLTLVSLLLFVAVTALWVRSYWFRDDATVMHRGRLLGFGSGRGTCNFEWTGRWPVDASRWHHRSRRIPPISGGWTWGHAWRATFGRFGYELTVVQVAPPGDPTPPLPVPYQHLWLPHWFLAAVAGLLPGWRAVSLVRSRRRAGRGLCPSCGYDLRATPGRCPECAQAPAGADA
jgi:hypothetical protein